MSTVFFVPERQVITAITRANPGVVTTQDPHGYLNGMIVRIVFPGDFGMNALNDRIFEITPLTTDTFSLNIDTRHLDAFTTSLSPNQVPQVSPTGEQAFTLLNAEQNGTSPNLSFTRTEI